MTEYRKITRKLHKLFDTNKLQKELHNYGRITHDNIDDESSIRHTTFIYNGYTVELIMVDGKNNSFNIYNDKL